MFCFRGLRTWSDIFSILFWSPWCQLKQNVFHTISHVRFAAWRTTSLRPIDKIGTNSWTFEDGTTAEIDTWHAGQKKKKRSVKNGTCKRISNLQGQHCLAEVFLKIVLRLSLADYTFFLLGECVVVWLRVMPLSPSAGAVHSFGTRCWPRTQKRCSTGQVRATGAGTKTCDTMIKATE